MFPEHTAVITPLTPGQPMPFPARRRVAHAMKKSAPACALLLLALLLSCTEAPEKIKVRVICNGASFSGWYDVDGDVKYFTDEAQTGDIYSASITLEDINEVEVDVTTGDDAYSLAVKVYREDTKVKSSSTYSTSGSVLYLNVSYTLGEEEEDDDEE
jgi:hypothetical protein